MYDDAYLAILARFAEARNTWDLPMMCLYADVLAVLEDIDATLTRHFVAKYGYEPAKRVLRELAEG